MPNMSHENVLRSEETEQKCYAVVLDEIVWDMIEPRGDDRSFQPRDIEEG